jgi:EAL domain-containing protein (putative c-di-GMP-specific phosphodiesterase class I)
MSNPTVAIAIMNNFHARGICLAIDDFGTGYSSLSYLKSFKIHKLKIDQSFVRNLTETPADQAIVSAVIDLSRNLGFKTIAEGVETVEQLSYLQDQGCDQIQGYYFSKPLPAEQFLAFINKMPNP